MPERKVKVVWMVQAAQLLSGETREKMKAFLMESLEPQTRASGSCRSCSRQTELSLERIKEELKKYLVI